VSIVYLDASAIVKLVVAEPESGPLQAWLEADRRPIVSIVGAVETMRAAARHGAIDGRRVIDVLAALDIVELTDELADQAGGLAPAGLRTLDAIHLASAIGLRRDLEAFVTYDSRLAEAARLHGLVVAAPA
jgi:predicted nucleic acid-binding protein